MDCCARPTPQSPDQRVERCLKGRMKGVGGFQHVMRGGLRPRCVETLELMSRGSLKVGGRVREGKSDQSTHSPVQNVFRLPMRPGSKVPVPVPISFSAKIKATFKTAGALLGLLGPGGFFRFQCLTEGVGGIQQGTPTGTCRASDSQSGDFSPADCRARCISPNCIFNSRFSSSAGGH